MRVIGLNRIADANEGEEQKVKHSEGQHAARRQWEDQPRQYPISSGLEAQHLGVKSGEISSRPMELRWRLSHSSRGDRTC